MIHLDTHVIVWLAEGKVRRLSRRARGLLGHAQPFASPMVAMELQYLHERGRLEPDAAVLLNDLFDSIGLRLSEAPFPQVARRAWSMTWTRDPFDRLIAASALVDDLPLLTADRTILENCPVAIWE